MPTPNPPSPPTRELRLRVAAGLPATPHDGVAATVLRSWERAQRAGLQPADRVLFAPSPSRADCNLLEEQHHALIRCATPDMQRLRRSFGSPNWIVLLANAAGTVVGSVGHDFAAARELREPLRTGKDLREEALGTNAPACALADGIATSVVGLEHYLDELQHYCCAAAPIRDPQGRLIAVLDVTGWQVAAEPDMLQRVKTSARAIENRLLHQLPDVAILRLHHDDRLLGTPLEGLLAIDDVGQVVGCNAAAARMLDLDPAERGGVSLYDLVPAGSPGLMAEHARADRATRFIRTRNGTGLHVAWSTADAARKATVTVLAHLPTRTSSARPGEDTLQVPFERALKVARRGLPVLIQGETGSGKEVFARRLHRHGRGEAAPFVAVNCSALPDGLIESELFGYVDGAFTGARRGGAPGKLVQAHGGTLFLDEIGDMPWGLQTRLLRVLQERAVVPVGGHHPVPVDLTVLSATHRDLPAAVAQGDFREDLFYRLAGHVVHLPALRERDDLQAVIDQVLHEIDPEVRLSEAVAQRLLAYRWPGNLRQLTQVLTAAVALCDEHDRVVQLDDLPRQLLDIDPAAPAHVRNAATQPSHGPGRNSSLSELKRRAIDEALARHGGNVSAAARELKLSRTTVYAHQQRGSPATPRRPQER